MPRAELTEHMVALLFSDEELSETARDGICRYLSECEPELRDDVLYRYFASSPQDAADRDPALVARQWAELAPALGLNPDRKSYGNGPRRPLWRRVALRAAAVLVPAALLAGGYFAWVRHNAEAVPDARRMAAAAFVPSTRIAPHPDSVRRITLTDGTEVMLNRGVSLAYNDNRQAELHGEAFFTIARDSARPFVIHSEHVTVQVLGTEFLFNTRGGDGFSRLALYGGTVEVDSDAGNYRLAVAGKAFVLDPVAKTVVVEDFDPSVKPDWVTEFEVEESFVVMSLGEIFDRVETACGVTIRGREKIDMNRRFNFTLERTMTAETVMLLLEFLHGDFQYRIDGNTVNLDKKGS